MLLDAFKLVVLCAKHVDVGHDTGVPKMIESIVNNKMTGAAGIENSMVSVLDTRMIEVGGRKYVCMKGGAIGGLAFALCPLMNYPIIDIEITDVFGSAQPMVWPDKDKGVVTGVPRIKVHPLTTWVVSILCLLGLSGNVGDFCWSGRR